MARVNFTSHLRRFFPDLEDGEGVVGRTVADVVRVLNARHPGLADYLIDESGALRQHVNVFVEEVRVADRVALTDPVEDDTRLFILQALSGG